jgi:hypothetical protein
MILSMMYVVTKFLIVSYVVKPFTPDINSNIPAIIVIFIDLVFFELRFIPL